MALLDTIQNAVTRVLPEKKPSLPLQASMTGGIGSGGVMPFQDNMIVSKPAIVFHASQAFFNFLAMCCFASVASFQAKWHVGPSGLTGFALFVSVTGILFPLFLLLVPVIYEKYDKGARLARALSEIRVGFIAAGLGTGISLLIAFITTISAWTEPGCKNADRDPHASLGDSFKNGLSGWCSTKKAGSVFFWFTFAFWAASLTLTVLDWRNGKSSRPRDPPFTHPDFAETVTHTEGDYDDEESQYHALGPKPTVDNSNAPQSPFADNNDTAYNPPSVPYNSAPAGTGAMPRPSIDAYGAFSDPAPTGFGAGSAAAENPRMSRTMQYADPYAAVRATITAGPAGAPPPGYASRGGYT
ncbi:hypothetical protein AcV5_008775 [Taiwanofungus camphoratus]|nr:hypothetical protein AcV5_008775 [Antrodia cinnamomea]